MIFGGGVDGQKNERLGKMAISLAPKAPLRFTPFRIDFDGSPMPFPTGHHPGAEWHKTDLQCHTPRDLDWKRSEDLPGGTAENEAAKAAWAASFVAECVAKGLKAVAVTDHHDACMVEYVNRHIDGNENCDLKIQTPTIAAPQPAATCPLQPTQSHAYANRRNGLATCCAPKSNAKRRIAQSGEQGNPKPNKNPSQAMWGVLVL